MKKYYILDIFEFEYTNSYAFDRLQDLLLFLFRYAKENPNIEYSYYIHQRYYNKAYFEKFNIDICTDRKEMN